MSIQLFDSELCARCRGRGFCNKPCRIYSKIKDFTPKTRTHFSGSSPPEIFVGRFNYPDISAGILSPETSEETQEFSMPEIWHEKKFSIDTILTNRSKLIYGKFHTNTKFDSNEPDFHTKDKEDLKLSICNENYLVIHFDYDKNNLYLSRTRGGGVISFEDKSEIFIIGIYSEILKMQNFDGKEEKQNLETVIRAVDHTRRYISKSIS